MLLLQRRGIYFVFVLIPPPAPNAAPPSRLPRHHPVGCDDALTAWRLFLEVPVLLWRSGGGWSRNSGRVVVCGVGVEDLGEGCNAFENSEVLSHCIDRRRPGWIA